MTAEDWRPTADWPALRLRDRLLRTLRAFFHERQFLEVETPLLSADVVVDLHLEPFSVPAAAGAHSRYLQTSPEFALKRLMAAGGEAIFQVARAFRQHECGRLHNPEFTLVEWYRRGDGMAEGMQLLSDLCEALLGWGPAQRLSYQQAFQRRLGLNPHAAAASELAAAATKAGIRPPESLSPDDRDGWLDLLLVESIEPELGQSAPLILYDYPASQAALARVRPADPPVAERFELYARGIELANGYHELLDAEVLIARNVANNRARVAAGKLALPEQSRLLDAMRHGLPPCCGVALGFDRLVMLAAGAESLADVMSFTWPRA